MKLADIIQRGPLDPAASAQKIPWDEPGFSARMLREHLTQRHDAASRRSETIDRHVAWIHTHVAGERTGTVLDLGCGPGLYTERLARLGHSCVGIDFSPASLEHALETASRDRLACAYRQRDLRLGDFGTGFDLALLVFGELNTFTGPEVEQLLRELAASLVSGARLVLEVHTVDAVREVGMRAPSWYSADSGLFSERPHVVLKEAAWSEPPGVSIERYLVIDAQSAEVSEYAGTLHAHSEQSLRGWLADAGFDSVERYHSLAGVESDGQPDLFVVVARRAGPSGV